MLFLELKSVRGRGISSKFPTDLTEAMERRIMRRGRISVKIFHSAIDFVRCRITLSGKR